MEKSTQYVNNVSRIGDKWRKITNYEHKEQCGLCREPESMEHILLECVEYHLEPTSWFGSWATGTAPIICKWSVQYKKWPTIKFGTILECSLTRFKRPLQINEKGKLQDKRKERLFMILILESAHFIWKIRCEWEISHQGIAAYQRMYIWIRR